MPGQIVNIGSLCIDFVYSLPQIVQEGVTLASTKREVFAGGKGLNQSLAAAKAGASVVHCGAIGPDGDMLKDTLKAGGVDVEKLLSLTEPSGHAVIQVVPSGANAIFVHGGSNRVLAKDYLSQCVKDTATDAWILLQNEINDIDFIVAQAAEQNLKVALNLAPADDRIAQYPIEQLSLLIVNIAEGQALAKAKGLPVADESSAQAAFVALAKAYPDLDVVMTLGDQGLLWHCAGASEAGRMQSIPVTPVDETAAGDSFVGYFLAALADGEALPRALQIGSIAGALAVTRAGAAPSVPDQEEVQAKQDSLPAWEHFSLS